MAEARTFPSDTLAPWAEIAPHRGARAWMTMAAKAQHYLRGGTRLVWIVWPGRREIDAWHPGSTDRPAATLGVDDVLDGKDVVPGFAHPVADVFADPLG